MRTKTSPLHKFPATIALLAINIVVYVVYLCGVDVSALALPADLSALTQRPWSVATYMFLHTKTIHLAINMCFLLLVGILYERETSSWRIAITYIIGGLIGAVAFESLYLNNNVVNPSLIGASAGIIAIYTALIASRLGIKNANNNKVLRLFPMWMLVLYALYCFFGIAGDNAGGNIAHIGGIIAGFALGLPVRLKISKKEKDPLIAKVEQSGYASLTDDERAQLFNKSKH